MIVVNYEDRMTTMEAPDEDDEVGLGLAVGGLGGGRGARGIELCSILVFGLWRLGDWFLSP